MTIGTQIRYASTFVGILALLGAYIGWQHIGSVKGQLEACTQQTVDLTQVLRKVQSNLLTIHQSYLEGHNPEKELQAAATQTERLKMTDPESRKKLLQLLASYRKVHAAGQSTELEEVSPLMFRGAELLSQAHLNNETRISSQSSEIEGLLSTLNKWIIGICLMMSIIAITLGQVIARGLSTSLNALEEAAQKMREGDFSHRAALNSNNEFGKLATTFNTLAAGAEQAETIEAQKVELENLNAQLKVKNDSLDSFVYRVSHDLKAPLVNIMSLQKIIKPKINLESDTTLSTSFRFLESNTEKLNQTIHDLLDVSRIERNLDNENSWVNIQSIVDEIKETNIEDIQNSKTKFSCDFSRAPEVNFNPANLLSILANLITNSIKYRKQEGQNHIEISSFTEDKTICISVKDNGIGLDLERHSQKLFGIFNRFHNHVEGSGVGLYIVKKLIEDNGGSINMESAVDEGTTFTIKFMMPQESLAVVD